MRRTVYAGVPLVGPAGAFVLGRGTAPAHSHAWEDSYTLGYDVGLLTGRTLQVGDSVVPTEKAGATTAFQAGNRAGQGDSWGDYDGGWEIGRPYVVIVGRGTGVLRTGLPTASRWRAVFPTRRVPLPRRSALAEPGQKRTYRQEFPDIPASYCQ
jgi:hypothetical protein